MGVPAASRLRLPSLRGGGAAQHTHVTLERSTEMHGTQDSKLIQLAWRAAMHRRQFYGAKNVAPGP